MVIPQAGAGAWRNRSPGGSNRLGVTLVAAILSLLLLLLLVALVASAVWTARGAAKRAACGRNLAKLVNALQVYAEAHGALPPTGYDIESSDEGDVRRVTWKALIETDVGDPRCFICPADESARAAEKSRPPESRATSFPCSYEYIWKQPAHEEATEQAGGARSDSRGSSAPDHADTTAPLLLCRQHDRTEERRATWCLVAYRDGTIKWERRRPPESLEPSGPASGEDEPPGTSARDQTAQDPAGSVRSEPAALSASGSDETTESHATAKKDRRSR